METFMVVATFRPETEMTEVSTVVGEERAQVEALRTEGRIGSIHVSMPRRVVFIEVFAPDGTQATDTVKTLPMSRWWDLDVYPTPAPILPVAAL